MDGKTKAAALLAAFALLLSLGCVKQPVGSDADEHGCIGSAGYSWCEPLQKCIRQWEENCTASQMVGNDRDEHGCIPSAGYAWCPEKEKCLRVWEEDCPSLKASSLEEQAKGFCMSGNRVYICGEYIRVVSDMPGAGSKFYKLGNYDPIAICPLVSPDSMSEQCRQLLMGNNCAEKEVDCGIAPAPEANVPGAVTDLADDPTFVGAQLSWTAPGANAVDYEVYRGNEALTEVSLIATVGATSYDDVFDGGNLTYAYFLRARNADGVQGPESNVVRVQQLSTAKQPSPGQID